MTKDNVLVGKTITKVMLAEDKEAVLFQTAEGDIKVRCDADCCSHTWVEHIELPVNGFPATVVSADDIPMPDLGSPDSYDVIAYYGFKIVTDKGDIVTDKGDIVTDKGDIVIDYRNESNGYYGGSLSWPDDSHFYGGVFGQNVSDEKWQDVAA